MIKERIKKAIKEEVEPLLRRRREARPPVKNEVSKELFKEEAEEILLGPDIPFGD